VLLTTRSRRSDPFTCDAGEHVGMLKVTAQQQATRTTFSVLPTLGGISGRRRVISSRCWSSRAPAAGWRDRDRAGTGPQRHRRPPSPATRDHRARAGWSLGRSALPAVRPNRQAGGEHSHGDERQAIVTRYRIGIGRRASSPRLVPGTADIAEPEAVRTSTGSCRHGSCQHQSRKGHR
jgi:hypothetical protein